MTRLRHIVDRVLEYLLQCIRIDTRTLAVFRIFAGVLIVVDIMLRARTFTLFYTDSGAVPLSLALDRSVENAFSFFYITSNSTVTALLFVLHALFAIQLIIGYKTRFATIISFLFVVSLDHRNPFVLSHADTLFRFLLFWAIFLPLAERWSIDAIQRTDQARSGIANIASAAILLQMLYMYLANGYHKTQSALWTTGEATPLIFGLDDTTYLLGDVMRAFPALLEYGGWIWYYMMLFSWVLLIAPGRIRTLLVGLYVAAHASFAITVRIGAFPWVAISGVILFLPARFWDDARALMMRLRVSDSWQASISRPVERFGYPAAGRLPRLELSSNPLRTVGDSVYDIAITVGIVAVLVVPGIGFLSSTDLLDREVTTGERQITGVAAMIGLRQAQWYVFAPNPRTVDRYYVFPAETIDGELYDVYNDRPMTFDRPYRQLQRQYGTYRERFYMNSVRGRGSQGDVPGHLADYICENWLEERGIELTTINMYAISERVTRETISSPSERESQRRLFYTHGCGDHEAREIALE